MEFAVGPLVDLGGVEICCQGSVSASSAPRDAMCWRTKETYASSNTLLLLSESQSRHRYTTPEAFRSLDSYTAPIGMLCMP